MTQLYRHPALILIEDQLDAIGQKYRLIQIVRGTMLWIAWGSAVSVAVALGGNLLGTSRWTVPLLCTWVAWVLASTAYWLVRPMIQRPSPVALARVIERRVNGLHNGLTNGVLLSQASDLAENPWLGAIYDEIAASCGKQSLDAAVRFSDLRSTALRLALPFGAAIMLAILMPAQLVHGWQQMFSPGRFVPTVGGTQIIQITPGNTTVAAGQALDIAIVARGPQTVAPPARIVFDSSLASVDLVDDGAPDQQEFHYSYRLNHVDAALRYRVEVAGTQSDWYAVNVVPKVTLSSLDVKITPPAYTRQAVQTVKLSPHDLEHAQITCPQGSRIEIAADIDVPASQATLMLDAQTPLPMKAALANHRFFAEATVLADAIAYVGIMSGDQIIAKVPDNGLSVRCMPDSPPTVTMQSPAQDISMAPKRDLVIAAQLSDDYGLTSARLLVGYGDGPLAIVPESEQRFSGSPTAQTVQFPLALTAEQSQHDAVVTVEVEATDNRDLADISKDLGPQSARGPKITIHFIDPKRLAIQQAEQSEKLADRLAEMIKLQQNLRDRTMTVLAASGGPTTRPVDANQFTEIGAGQSQLRDMMRQTAQTFDFTDRTRVVQKTLLVLAVNAGSEAVDLASQIAGEPVVREQFSEAVMLKTKQESILQTLQTLLAGLSASDVPATQPDSAAGGNLPARLEAFKKLDDALKQYEKEQQRILNQSAQVAKKPVADFDNQDKKSLDDLRMGQDKLDAFMQQNLSDFSKNAEQDMSNPSLLKELLQIYSEVTMAKDALTKQSVEMAVPLEEEGLESAQELESNIEKWLANAPDRTAWSQEDPLTKTDTPMPELPKELEDMVGNLLEQQEDLDQQAEDANANWQDSFDKAIGWDAQDGPIADMSAKGVTGNTLPNNNEMQGRSGDGRTGQSQGEFVGDSATDKGGRNTPTRLDPTPFQAGQIKDTSGDPAGGATGGGKMSGEGAAGLEGPVPPKMQEAMQRLAKQQAEIRNAAEKLNLQYKLGRYDNFKLLQSIVNMRQTESDLNANRYQNALRHIDETVDDLSTSSVLVGGRMRVDEDTTPASNQRSRKEIDDAAQGDLPPVWSESLREYYRKLAEQ
jgi:hypothetical protein